jgi:hypothetical protein
LKIVAGRTSSTVSPQTPARSFGRAAAAIALLLSLVVVSVDEEPPVASE